MVKTKKTQRGGLYKATIRFWHDDIQYMRKTYPNNYTAEVRDLLAKFVDKHKKQNT